MLHTKPAAWQQCCHRGNEPNPMLELESLLAVNNFWTLMIAWDSKQHLPLKAKMTSQENYRKLANIRQVKL